MRTSVIRLLHVLMVSSICVEVNKNWVNILIDANECAKYINKNIKRIE